MLDNALPSARNKQRLQRKTTDPLFDSGADPDKPVRVRDGAQSCDHCGNKRFVLQDVFRNGQFVETRQVPCPKCDVVRLWKMEALRGFSSRSEYSATQTFHNFKTQFDGEEDESLVDCLQASVAFADKPNNSWLVMWGERGTGKSHLCAAVDNHLYHAGIPSLFITMPDLLEFLRRAMDMQSNTEEESYSGRFKLLKTAPVLILDDLGSETVYPWGLGVLTDLIDYRYRNRLPTMIATNVHLNDFDQRISSRLQDTDLCVTVENASADFRKRDSDQKRAAK